MKKNRLRSFCVRSGALAVSLLLLCSVSCKSNADKKVADEDYVVPSNLIAGCAGGYLVSRAERMDQAYGGGYSMYVTVYPLEQTYPGREFQSGLFGTWMFPYNETKPDKKMYSDIEGGLGWWRDTEFATETPKFIMGGVQLNFYGWANGPGAGKGRDWSKPRGKYGIAQLSPWVVWPPDGLNMKQGSCGEVLGSGYLPLPLTEPKATTGGKNIKTVNQCWTLFLNTKNFKGPVAFFLPYFWSETYLLDPELSGKFFDQRPSGASKAFQQETQHIHSYAAVDSKGNRYARMAPTQYPVDEKGNADLVHRLMVYKKEAMWNRVEAWFKGGPVADTKIDLEQGKMQGFTKGVHSSWRFFGAHIPKSKQARLNITDFMDYSATDPTTLRFHSQGDLLKKVKTSNGKSVIVLPEYYKWEQKNAQDSVGKWVAVDPKSVPEETNLQKVVFKNRVPRNKMPYVTPDAPESSWKTPGPVAGPFKAKLGDGSTITYYWYRFCDQPAVMNADMTKAEREEMQRRVELLHKHWTKEKEYLPAPLNDYDLTEIDPALIVTPPKGYEIGYVPIVTSQGI